MREELRRKLVKDAERNDRTLNGEIVDRLEHSYAQADRLEEIFGGARNVALFKALGGHIGLIEAERKKGWSEDHAGVIAVARAFADLLAKQMPGFEFVQIGVRRPDGEIDRAMSFVSLDAQEKYSRYLQDGGKL